jgi:hypothetical protein
VIISFFRPCREYYCLSFRVFVAFVYPFALTLHM